jgi:hypothetical protein
MYDSCIKRGHHVVPGHQEKSWPSIRQPTAGGWPRAPPAGPRLLARCIRAALRRRPSCTARAPSAGGWGREGKRARPGAAADPRRHARKGGARRCSSPPRLRSRSAARATEGGRQDRGALAKKEGGGGGGRTRAARARSPFAV